MPKQNAGQRQQYQQPGEQRHDDRKIGVDEWPQQKCNVDRVRESFLVLGIGRALRIKRTAVVAELKLAGDLGTIGAAMMHKKFARAQPARIEIGEIAARPSAGSRLSELIRNEDALDVVQHAAGK